ncbi:MAG TPA: hypothetical protein VF453_06715 [Burkholderiaceae bacterium]
MTAAAESSCRACGHAPIDGCSRVECPERKAWSAGALDDLAPAAHSGVFSTNGQDGHVQVGTAGCFRRVKHRGAE